MTDKGRLAASPASTLFSAGGEDFAFSGEGKRFGRGGGGTTTLVLQTVLDGQVIAETQLPHIARALRLRGIAA